MTTHDNRRTFTLVQGAALAVTAALALAACGSSGSDAGTSSSAGSSTTASAAQTRVTEALKPIESIPLSLQPLSSGAADLTGKTIVVVPLAAEIFSAWLPSFEEALKPTGATIEICDGKGIPSQMSSCIEQAPALGADAVVTIAVSPTIAGNAYKELQAKGIPTFVGFQNAEGTAETETLRFGDSVPALEAGLRLSSDYILSKVKDPNILVLGTSDSPPAQKVSATTTAELKKDCNGCSIVSKLLSSAQANQATALTSSQLLIDPRINAVSIFNADQWASGVLEGMRGAGKTSGVVVGGPASGLASMQLLQKKQLTYVAMLSPSYQSWVLADGILRLLDGKPAATYPPVTRLFDASNVAGVEASPATAGTFDWFGTPVYQDEFRTSWGLS